MATVEMLRNSAAISSAVDTAATCVDDAAKKTGRSLKTFNDEVRDPLNAGVAWSGTGQPEASVVARANQGNLDAAILRLDQARQALSAFSVCMGQAASWWSDMQINLGKAKFAVTDDGTVCLKPGAELEPGEVSPETLTNELKQILSYLDTADSALASRLRECATDRMPSPTSDAHPGIEGDAHASWEVAWNDRSSAQGRESDPNWTPTGNTHAMGMTEWQRALGIFGLCPPNGIYNGGGYMIGPDGRKYPIATPTMTIDGKRYTHGDGVESLGGSDVGWQTVDTRVGFGQLGEPTPGVSKALVFLGGLAGASYKPVVSADPRATANLQFDQNGFPINTTPPDPKMTKPPSGNTEEYTVVGTDGKGQTTVSTYKAPGLPGSNQLSIVTQGLEGANAANHMDDKTYYTYRAEFQQNTDGRTRVVYTTYQVQNGPDGQTVTPYDTHVGADGKLVMEKASWYDAPSSTPEAGPAHQIKVDQGN